jgi:hypothetical protein
MLNQSLACWPWPPFGVLTLVDEATGQLTIRKKSAVGTRL